jgi:hypothetical protein
MGSPLHVRIAKKQVGPDVEAAIGDTSVADGCLVPGDDSSTGNVTGGCKLARCVLEERSQQRVFQRNGFRSRNYRQPSIATNASLKPEPMAGAGC